MSSTISILTGGVTAPRGFRAAGVSAGIKANGGLDLMVLVSDTPAQTAAVFTTNLAVAAPVVVSREHLGRSRGITRAIVVNSGCANACTGDEGLQVARDMAWETARLVNCPAEQVLVASTGVIGVALPIGLVRGALPAAFDALGSDQDHGALAARAIMTTDPFPKESAAQFGIGGRDVTIGGMAKGSGMIEPMLATMLAFVTTDAAMPMPLLDRALREAVNETFNAITVDGECSTNDCVMLLANGAGGATVDEGSYGAFVSALTAVCRELALGIVRGGEGATKLITIEVSGGATDAEAKQAARAIANSPLVKTAVHGADPNWGRLVAVAGRAGVAFNLERARIQIGDIELFAGGRPYDERAAAASDYLLNTDVTLRVDLGTGKTGAARMWTCDLSADYVKINAEYRT